MRVIKVGKGAEFFETTCNNCKSVLEYTENEVQKTGNWYRTGVEESEWIGYEYIKCPVCGKQHKLRDVSCSY